jgi:uncharacterized protein
VIGTSVGKSPWFYLFFGVLTTTEISAILSQPRGVTEGLVSTMDLIIDGYNLIGAEGGLYGALEHKRNRLIQQLAAYEKRKGFNLILVFDGWRSGRPAETKEKHDNVWVLYSRAGEKADSVIVRLAREKGSGCVVVTSDREIARAVERFGAVAIFAGEFNEILRSLEGAGYEDEFDEPETEATASFRKGKLGKSDRRRREKLRKLRL